MCFLWRCGSSTSFPYGVFSFVDEAFMTFLVVVCTVLCCCFVFTVFHNVSTYCFSTHAACTSPPPVLDNLTSLLFLCSLFNWILYFSLVRWFLCRFPPVALESIVLASTKWIMCLWVCEWPCHSAPLTESVAGDIMYGGDARRKSVCGCAPTAELAQLHVVM